MNMQHEQIYAAFRSHKEDIAELLSLQLPVKLQVWFDESSGGFLQDYPLETMGLYLSPSIDFPMHTVCVRMEGDVIESINSLAHEMRHAYQFENGLKEDILRGKLHQFVVSAVSKVSSDVAHLQYANEWVEVDARTFASWYVGGEDMPCPTVPMLEDMRSLYPSLSDGELRMMRTRDAYTYERDGVRSDVIR